jgi:hypothetical protein
MNNNNNPMMLFQQMLSMGNNPQQIEQMILQQNPQLQVISNQMKQSGMSPLDFVMQYARQNHVNPNLINQMVNQMRGMLPK